MNATRIPATLLAVAFALVPLVGASHGGSHVVAYAAGTTGYSSAIGCQTVNGVTACAVAGGMVCDSTTDGTGVGGACPPVLVPTGAYVTATVADLVFGPISWAICIDGDGNGICRPETPADTIAINSCADSPEALTVQNAGPAGYLAIFIMSEVNPSNACGATSGVITWDVSGYGQECSDGVDNDGNGFTDYPADPNCSSPFDDSERVPPPPVRGH